MIRLHTSSLMLYSLNQIRTSTTGDKQTCNASTKYTWEKKQQFQTTETVTKQENATWQWPSSSPESTETKSIFYQHIQNLGSWISKKIPSIDNQRPTEFQRGRAIGYEEGYKDGIWKGMSMTALYGSAMVGISTIFGRLYRS